MTAGNGNAVIGNFVASEFKLAHRALPTDGVWMKYLIHAYRTAQAIDRSQLEDVQDA
jgi:hypothetical protein